MPGSVAVETAAPPAARVIGTICAATHDRLVHYSQTGCPLCACVDLLSEAKDQVDNLVNEKNFLEAEIQTLQDRLSELGAHG